MSSPQARHLADEARIAVRHQASDDARRAAAAVDQLAGRLRALADGDTDRPETYAATPVTSATGSVAWPAL